MTLSGLLLWWKSFGQGWIPHTHERHVVSNHRSSDCLFTSLCGPISKKHYYWSFVRGIHQWPVNTPHEDPVTRKNLRTSSWYFCELIHRNFVHNSAGNCNPSLWKTLIRVSYKGYGKPSGNNAMTADAWATQGAEAGCQQPQMILTFVLYRYQKYLETQ